MGLGWDRPVLNPPLAIPSSILFLINLSMKPTFLPFEPVRALNYLSYALLAQSSYSKLFILYNLNVTNKSPICKISDKRGWVYIRSQTRVPIRIKYYNNAK